jgi:hypothetical protein
MMSLFPASSLSTGSYQVFKRILFFISMLLMGPRLLAEEETLHQMIQRAEEPLENYRVSYLKAIKRASDDARKAGQVEKMPTLVKDIEEFTAGGWPDGVGINEELEKVFILKYRPVYTAVDVRLRAIASKYGTEEVDTKVNERLKFWKEPMTTVYKSKNLVTVRWNVARDPVAAGYLGQPTDVDNKTLGERKSLKYSLSGCGIAFPEGASALISQNVLRVTNTWTEILKIEQLLHSWHLIK